MSKKSIQSLTENSYLFGGNADYLETLYEQFLKDPTQLDPSWKTYFEQLDHNRSGASHADVRTQFAQLAQNPYKAQKTHCTDVVDALTRTYQTHGHLAAWTNPLQDSPPKYPDVLNSERYAAVPKALIDQLKHTYCASVGAEFMYISNPDERDWLAEQLQNIAQTVLSAEEKKEILKQLIAADGLEKYLGSRYVGQKRFSLEGGDSFIAMVHAINEQFSKNGGEEVVIGMAHRGRLNTLINIFGKPPGDLFAQFEGRKDYGLTSGDVKYHMGYASDIKTPYGDLHISLAFNPSHLEVIAPVLMGSVRARQQRRPQQARAKVLALVVHGDAAFAGQGVIMESLQMSQTRAYSVQGTVHIIINNQVGFTTSNPQDARTSHYCTDVAKMIDCPVFHVNGDDPEAVVKIARLAVDYRDRFHKDVFIDLVCYRRLGHNEADEPAATQPRMYHIIRQRPVARELYAQRLIAQAICSTTEIDAMINAYRDGLDAEQPVVKTYKRQTQSYASDWKPYLGQLWTAKTNTGVPKKTLIELAQALEKLPEGFVLQRQVGNAMAARAQMTAGELPLDWGYAEILAYATLLNEGYAVRMSGQDCRRGTFSHRHAALHDQETGHVHIPLSHIKKNQASFDIYDSLLSEMGVMGFEYGYASTDPRTLVLWEAQYGDFANGAQMIIDQFISSAWQKWGTLSGLVLLLPHGYEGGGPEHTSARLERFLQLSAQDNIQVCVPTTPAQIFHLLRRQVIRPYRTPLIVMTPKSLLRSKAAVSTLEELSQGEFQVIIPDNSQIAEEKITKVVLCSGKVYYDLVTARKQLQKNHIAILRIEQLYPFPQAQLGALLARYKKAKDIVWCQEEPKNQGAWDTRRHCLEACLAKGQHITYAGRDPAASPAAGYSALHEKQQKALVEQAMQ